MHYGLCENSECNERPKQFISRVNSIYSYSDMLAKHRKLHQHLLTKTARNIRDGEQATTYAKQMVSRVLLLPWNLKVLTVS